MFNVLGICCHFSLRGLRTAWKKTSLKEVKFAVVSLLVFNRYLFKRLLLLFCEIFPSIGNSSHDLLDGQERVTLTDDISELL